jgi:hypothetical protein
VCRSGLAMTVDLRLTAGLAAPVQEVKSLVADWQMAVFWRRTREPDAGNWAVFNAVSHFPENTYGSFRRSIVRIPAGHYDKLTKP